HPAASEPVPLSLHDALPIWPSRRRSERKPCIASAECEGASGAYRARTLDVSKSGAVLDIRDTRFLDISADSSLLAFASKAFQELDRKSTRLNSSHQIISYAV